MKNCKQIPFEIKGYSDHSTYFEFCAWQEDEIIPKNKPLPSDNIFFLIQIRTRDFPISKRAKHLAGEGIWRESLGPTKKKSFWMTRASLLNSDYESKAEIYYALVSLGVPEFFAFRMLDEVACFGRSMVTAPRNAGRKVLPMVFAVVGWRYPDFMDVINDKPRKRRFSFSFPYEEITKGLRLA